MPLSAECGSRLRGGPTVDGQRDGQQSKTPGAATEGQRSRSLRDPSGNPALLGAKRIGGRAAPPVPRG